MASTFMKGSQVAVGHDYDGVVGVEGDDGGSRGGGGRRITVKPGATDGEWSWILVCVDVFDDCCAAIGKDGKLNREQRMMMDMILILGEKDKCD
uniref:Uncharacterized protein n=1 Tax=Tanacetum cinerariifolium TaxID=118510 RepID=A0A699I9T4_TANCI|nr:hypothetical protein [Tanacetum cinerariifolium]